MQEYIVQAKDSLWKIAKTHGTTVDALAKINGIKGHRVHDLKIGQKLHIPGADHEDPDCVFKLQFRGLNSQVFTPKKVIVEHDGVKTTHDMMGKDALLLSIADHAQGLKVWVEDLVKAQVQVMDEAILPIGKWALSVDSRKMKIQGNMLPESGKPQATTEKLKAATAATAQKSGGELVQEQTRVESGAPTHALATIYTSENLRLNPKNEKYRQYIIDAAKKYNFTPQAIAAFLDVEAAKNADGSWIEDSNSQFPSKAQGLAQFFPAGWTDVLNCSKSLLHVECKDLSKTDVLKKRCEAKYAIDGLAAYIGINLAYLKSMTGWPTDFLPPEDKAKVAYLLHHEGVGNALRYFGKGVAITPEAALASLKKQLSNDEKVDDLIYQYGDAVSAYKGWFFNTMIDPKINVKHFLVDSTLSKDPRKIADIISEIISQPSIPKPKPKQKTRATTEKPHTTFPTKPLTSVFPLLPITAPSSIPKNIITSGESLWFDPLACCTIRVAKLASIIGATFGMTRTTASGLPRGHQGLDLAASPGTPIVAVANGTIALPPNYSGDYGKKLMLVVGINDLPEKQLIEFKKTYPSEIKIGFFYAHLSEIDVEDGQSVKAGDIIGKTGCTGNAGSMTTISLGAHLHFEVRKVVASYNKTLANRIDPLPFINNCTNRPN
ncbi:MAG: peptidoglycan DD-metalloendopeptidase family protein [Pseudomonadota bacterium]